MKRLAILFAIAVAACAYVFVEASSQAFTYRYRLQLGLSIDDQVHTGSSVIEVVWQCGKSYGNSHRELGPCYPSLGGQAAVIDLGPRGVIAATLRTGENYTPTPDGAIDAVWLCGFAFGNQSTNAELAALPRLTGRRDISPSNFPRLVWFPNPADPQSATKVTFQNIASILDQTAHFTEAFVEITKDPILLDIPNKLPWFTALQREQKNGGIPSKSGQFQIVHNMFVGENS